MPRAAAPRPPAVRSRGSLATYRRKRNFASTPEPDGSAASASNEWGRAFVIQKHAASRLHYDFRLELGGTLKSWAVPKGIPMEKGERRLAVAVEDHPLDYGNFEGVIPQGQYGGGTVMLWDRGTYEPVGPHPARDLAAGKLHFVLHGTKCEGEWALVRMEDGDNWLLIRISDSAKPISKAANDRSAASERTMRQIAEAGGPTWQSPPRVKPEHAPPRVAVPDFYAPMLAKLVATAPAGGNWSYEVKFDGYRVMARKDGRDVRLLSRNGLDLTKRFSPIAAAVAELGVEQALFDGEVVALDEDGKSSFDALADGGAAQLAFYVFDLPWSEGVDLRQQSLEKRREVLERLLSGAQGPVRFSAALEGDPDVLMEQAGKLGLEGLVAKRLGSRYEAGLRTGAWVKLKCVNQQEFVIGGYTPPRGSREHFGAIVIGHYEGGKFRFAGKVGSGFTRESTRALHALMVPLRVDECPFDDPDRALRKVQWVRPALVCEVKFTEWTRDGHLRHPVYLRLRQDKAAKSVHREQPGSPT